jgi:2',3'-cyclic-nucleotide 2'-phosphodiesterase (5'-nucleotidase family)
VPAFVYKNHIKGVLTLLSALALLCTSAWAEPRVSLLITSNLQGRFSLDVENQERADPLLLLGQSIVSEQDRGLDLYLDMGNALYPGILSKYSAGAIMMDFLDYFACQAVLVSSQDLQVGTKNLEFLGKNKKVRLLSANIMQEQQPAFTPWITVDRAGIRIALLALSSKKIRFDMAEKDLYGYHLAEEKEALGPQLEEIRAAGIKYIILLSGQTLKDTAEILEAYPEIGLALCGGDYTGRLFGGKASRLDLADGRSIVIANDGADYYLLQLLFDDGIKVQSLEAKKAQPIPTRSFLYQEFRNRLALWKHKFVEDEDRPLTSLKETAYGVNDLRFAQLLRDRFNCELGVVETNTINTSPVSQQVTHSDLLSMVNLDYTIFLFSLTGAQLPSVLNEKEELVIAGLDAGKGTLIQGSPIVADRPYRIAASQPAMQKIQHLLGKRLAYRNTWMTVTDLLADDLKNQRVILRSNYDYLDRRFRTTVDASLSNFVDNSSVRREENVDTPPGQPVESYNKWGLENSIDVTIYNKYHRFVISPYMLYSRQDDSYLNNILRGTLLYDYNLSETIKPYNKFRCDTVVEEVDGLRPMLLRETLGVSVEYPLVNGKLGLGFEKEAQDPVRPALYGAELILGVRIPFLSHFVYTFDIDAFGGIRGGDDAQRQIRSEINNTVSAIINNHLSVSFRYKYFYFHEDLNSATYQNSQFITSLDLKNNWKFW